MEPEMLSIPFFCQSANIFGEGLLYRRFALTTFDKLVTFPDKAMKIAKVLHEQSDVARKFATRCSIIASVTHHLYPSLFFVVRSRLDRKTLSVERNCMNALTQPATTKVQRYSVTL